MSDEREWTLGPFFAEDIDAELTVVPKSRLDAALAPPSEDEDLAVARVLFAAMGKADLNLDELPHLREMWSKAAHVALSAFIQARTGRDG